MFASAWIFSGNESDIGHKCESRTETAVNHNLSNIRKSCYIINTSLKPHKTETRAFYDSDSATFTMFALILSRRFSSSSRWQEYWSKVSVWRSWQLHQWQLEYKCCRLHCSLAFWQIAQYPVHRFYHQPNKPLKGSSLIESEFHFSICKIIQGW